MPRTRNKGKQTWLSFAPVPSSAADEGTGKDKSPRLAKVRYDHLSIPLAQGLRSSSPQADKSPKNERESLFMSSQDNSTKMNERHRKRKSRTSSGHDDAEESNADEIITKPRRRLRRGNTPKQTTVLDDDSDDDVIVSSPAKRRTRNMVADTPQTPRRGLRRGNTPKPTIVLDDDSDDDMIISSPAKRRRRNMVADIPHTPHRGSDQDKLDLKEDLEDLQDSVVKESRTRGRPANSARAKRQQHLETLRRRRAGDKIEDAEKSESESEDEDEDSESEESPSRKTAGLRNQNADSDVESSIASNEDLDKSDDEFVLADEDAELGAPVGSNDIPLEFTRHAYKQTKEYFQDAVEWMVHNRLNPAFPRTSPHYKLAFAKLEDEVRGRAGSQLLSSSWNVGFRRALMARPHIEVTMFAATVEHHCDACNRSGHPASSDVKFSGKAYSLETLEPVTDEESDEENSEDSRERDRNGDILPDDGTRFLLGRHCKKMADMAHTLIHWRFHLNEWVTDYLDDKGILDDEEILQRSHWSQRRKERYANETLAMMIETGEIQKLWRDFHINLRAARQSMSQG